ncbi:MAG: HK97-gp10 family putative phage morphogenesis protein, partial [Methyloligellaceae bacterium]
FIDISILGDKELQRMLNDKLPKDAKKAMRKGLRAGARPVLKQAKDTAPKRTGALRRGIKLRALKRSRKSIGVTVSLPTRESLGIPAGAKYYYPAALEFGTKHIPAKRFLRAALYDNEKRFFGIVRSTLRNELIKNRGK